MIEEKHIREYKENGVYEKNYLEISYDSNTNFFELINISDNVRDFSKLNMSLFKEGIIKFNP